MLLAKLQRSSRHDLAIFAYCLLQRDSKFVFEIRFKNNLIVTSLYALELLACLNYLRGHVGLSLRQIRVKRTFGWVSWRRV